MTAKKKKGVLPSTAFAITHLFKDNTTCTFKCTSLQKATPGGQKTITTKDKSIAAICHLNTDKTKRSTRL